MLPAGGSGCFVGPDPGVPGPEIKWPKSQSQSATWPRSKCSLWDLQPGTTTQSGVLLHGDTLPGTTRCTWCNGLVSLLVSLPVSVSICSLTEWRTRGAPCLIWEMWLDPFLRVRRSFSGWSKGSSPGELMSKEPCWWLLKMMIRHMQLVHQPSTIVISTDEDQTPLGFTGFTLKPESRL